MLWYCIGAGERGERFYQEGVASANAGKYEEAVKHFQKAAAKDNIQGIFSLGVCYQFGNGVKKSLKTAMQFYQKAADSGSGAGYYSLGSIYAS